MNYFLENRNVYSQKILLPQNRIKEIIIFLEKNYLPENRYYFYDFLYDNCATRIRDLLENELSNNLNYNVNYLEDVTYRQLLDKFQEPKPWVDFAIDLILGVEADEQAKGHTDH